MGAQATATGNDAGIAGDWTASQHDAWQFLVEELEVQELSLRLSELLPIEPEIKQALLQIRWPKERLTELSRIVSKFQG